MNKTTFFSFWLTNSIFLLICSYVFPQSIVLGNIMLLPIIAAIISGLLLTIIISLVPFLIKISKIKVKKEENKILIYLAFNIAGIWIIARGATVTGFGISAYWIALLLGIIVNFLQWGIWKQLPKKTR